MNNLNRSIVLLLLLSCLSFFALAQEKTTKGVPTMEMVAIMGAAKSVTKAKERVETAVDTVDTIVDTVDTVKAEIAQRVERTFVEHDADEDDKLSWEEFRGMHVVRAEDIKQRIAEMEDEGLEVPEELTIRLRRAESAESMVPQEEEVRTQFTSINTDEDEFITQEEFTNHHLEQLDERMQIRLRRAKARDMEEGKTKDSD